MVYLLTRSLDVCTVVSAVLSKGFGKERSDERILYGSLVSGILLFTDQNNLIVGTFSLDQRVGLYLQWSIMCF